MPPPRETAAWRRLSGATPPTLLGALAAVAGVALSTALIYLLRPLAPVESLGVVYLPAILLTSIVWGARLGLASALLSVVAFNFFHLPPLHQLDIAEEQGLVALAAFGVAAVLTSAVAGLARARAREAERGREEAAETLSRLEALMGERERMQAEAVEAEAVRRSDELKTVLLRSVSHDLRTPLTSIIAAGSALDSQSLTAEERAELSAGIVQEGGRLSHLLDNLLDLSRLEAGGSEPHRTPLDLSELLETVRGQQPRSVQIRVEVEDGLPLVNADAAQLERAFANLLENAVRYGDGRPVLIRSRMVGERVVVRVVDQGPGISEPDRGRIFEPFQHGGGANSGTGLGLAITKGFIEANSGQIEIESVPGQGTSFVVTLPPVAGERQ